MIMIYTPKQNGCAMKRSRRVAKGLSFRAYGISPKGYAGRDWPTATLRERAVTKSAGWEHDRANFFAVYVMVLKMRI